MASSTTPSSRTSEEYDEQKGKVLSQLENKQLQPVDLYYLASLLAAWRTNDTLPVCLLCQTAEATKNKFGLGHIIPHSVLRNLPSNCFTELNQGKESGISNMGYRAFCRECEEIFSSLGELHFNPKFFAPFYEKQDNMIKVDVHDKDGNPWMYFFLVSVVWRCLCFIPLCKYYIQVLEYLRNFLLIYPTGEHDIESKITFYIFAPNSAIESKCKKENILYMRYFNEFCTAKFDCHDPENPDLMAAWVLMGPVHILMIYNSVGSHILPLPFGLS